MNGVHDLGGRHGFGAIDYDTSEEVFHDRWEAVVFAITNRALASGVAKNVDHFRHSVERIDPVSYLSDTYYGRWLGGVETLLEEAGVLRSEDITQRAVERGADREARVAARPSGHTWQDDTPRSQSAARRGVVTAKFSVGDMVTTRNLNPSGHTRLPSYARGACGCVVAEHGAWVLPDANAHGRGEQPETLYTIAFEGSELWGDTTEPCVSVRLDLFESYLESRYLEAK